MKAIMGHGSSFAGDHVELSDGGDDFASSVGVGAVISTKFTWPKDTDNPVDKLPPGGFVLTPAEGGAVAQVGGTLQAAHAAARANTSAGCTTSASTSPKRTPSRRTARCTTRSMRSSWNGPVQLRGLGAGTYRVRDLFNDTDLGTVDARANTLTASFEKFLLRAAPDPQA